MPFLTSGGQPCSGSRQGDASQISQWIEDVFDSAQKII